ncbi:glycosyltransferase family 4 protein [Ferroplasma sp.]|jgi:glycosyltransferase involved in cell wall biosynthesis|uniref:glycosyltransferase family 4 protein n=1 Tax=Ferroplasma sp. TaxID=2591003 RepID=UPI0026182152|nr:glycosyltransferase family 4 protein [Ferroplasma sp.]
MHLTFFNTADLRTGRGCEQVLLHLINYKPSDINITIVQTDFLDFERVPQSYIDEVLKDCELITIRTFVNSYKSVFGGYSHLISKLLFKDVRGAKKMGNYKEIRNTDIVYLFGNSFSSFFSGLHIPIIGSNHTFNPSDFFSQKKLSFIGKLKFYIVKITLYRNINGFHLFPYNEYILPVLRTKYNFLLPNGVDTSIFYPSQAHNNKKLKLLFVAALTYEKGLDILLPVISRLKENNNLEFHIAGKGPLENDVKGIKSVIYHGGVTENELTKLYSDADIFIYPSHNDTYSLVILQALSSGLYVISGDYLRGVFDDFEEKGYLEYIPLNSNSFYERIKAIESGINVPNIDRAELHNYVKKNYDWKIIAESFYSNLNNIYKESVRDYQNDKAETS